MRRVLCVYLPTFSTDLVKRNTLLNPASATASREILSRPILLTRPIASRERVVRCCQLAAASQVRAGMDLAHARSLLSDRAPPRIEPHRPEVDAAALHALAVWALRFSPLTAPDDPDGLLIDFTGTQRVHRGENRLIRAVANGLARRGFAARVAAASTFGCAWAVSRFGRHALSSVPPGREADALRDLPVAALRVDDTAILGLHQIGITTVDHLLRLPRSSLASRFDLSLVRRLQQALGQLGEAIEPVRPAHPLRRELLFDGPTDRWESLEAAARQTLELLAADLLARERGVRRLDIQFLRVHAPPTQFQINLSRPSCSVKHLWSLLRSRLEKVDLGSDDKVGLGGIEGVAMTALRTARLRYRQLTSDKLGADEPRITAEAAFGELADTLVARLSAENVVRLEPVETHIPERAVRECSVMAPMPRIASPAAITHADRPTILFQRPEPATVMALTPDGPLLSLGWRNRRWTVVSCTGPERIGPEWWRWGRGGGTGLPAGERTLLWLDGPGDARHRPEGRCHPPHLLPPDRDYFAVQTQEGRRLWVCRQVDTGRWFVHGEWS